MKITIHVTINDEEDSFSFEADTIEEAREIAWQEILKRGWRSCWCWSEVEE